MTADKGKIVAKKQDTVTDLMSIEEANELVLRAKKEWARFTKEQKISFRQKTKGPKPDFVNFQQLVVKFIDGNSDALTKAYDSTTTKKRPVGQLSLKFKLDKFIVTVSKPKLKV
jgi:hypothetical protein